MTRKRGPTVRRHRTARVQVPSSRAEFWEIDNWYAAVAVLRDSDRGDVKNMTWSQFVRDVLNDAAELVFEQYGPPIPGVHIRPPDEARDGWRPVNLRRKTEKDAEKESE